MSRADDLKFVPLGVKSPNYEYTLSQARCTYVFKSERTKEFLEARETHHHWIWYKNRCLFRHRWGIYLRTRLDWDWDSASCLQHLFQLPEEMVLPTAPNVTVDLDTADADSWNVTTDTGLPKKMKFAYKSVKGETKYRTFLFSPSSDDFVSTGELEQVVGVQNKTLTTIPEPRDKCKEADNQPEAETDSELGAKQVVEKQGVVSLISEEPSCGVRVEDRDESEVVVHESCDTPPAQERV